MAAPISQREMSNLTVYCVLFCQLLCLSAQISIQPIRDDTFNKFVTSNNFVLVYFGRSDCERCEKEAQELERIAEYAYTKELKILKTESVKLAQIYGVRNFPTIMFFRKALPIMYETVALEADDVVSWIEFNKDPVSKILHDDDFEHLTQAATGATTGDWLVLFYRHEDGCRQLLATIETITPRINQRTNTARVNLAASKELQKRFEIKKCPTLILFRHGKQYTYDLPDTSIYALKHFTEGGYKNLHGIPVKPEPTPFDTLTESIVLKLEAVPASFRGLVIVGSFLTFAAILLFIMYKCSSPKPRAKFD